MLRVPIGLEIRVDLAVDHEHAGSALVNPRFKRIEIGELAHRSAARSKAAGDLGKIGLRKLHDVYRVALPAKIMDLGRIGTVVVNQDAQTKLQPDWRFQVSHRHQESAVAGAEYGKLAGIGDGKPESRMAARARPIGTNDSDTSREHSGPANSVAPSRKNGLSRKPRRDLAARSHRRLCSKYGER